MDIIVLKFGGSSVADNEKLKLVANQIIDLRKKNQNIVVVVSAQGKTTDRLISEANEIAEIAEDREMDALLSSGEQVSTAKLSILLNEMGYNAISLTGWQAGIYTDDTNQNATIQYIDTTRIKKELENGRIVVVAGFQGINQNMDITTLGRGGSDTTAVAIASALKAKKCYIFSDVDGVYTADPKQIHQAKKLSNISYREMLDLSSEGAKVLHHRCVEIGEKYQIPIITKSTFHKTPGTIISDVIEKNTIKSITKKEVSRISIVGNGIIRNITDIKKILDKIDDNKLEMLELNVTETKISITFKQQISEKILNEIHEDLIEK